MYDDQSTSVLKEPQPSGPAEDNLQPAGLPLHAGDDIVRKDPRRLFERFPIPYQFRLTPIVNRQLLKHEELFVVGKDASLTGVSFTHEHPIDYHRVLLELESSLPIRVIMEAEIIWTRKTPRGHFESGGPLRWFIPEGVLPEDTSGMVEMLLGQA